MTVEHAACLGERFELDRELRERCEAGRGRIDDSEAHAVVDPQQASFGVEYQIPIDCDRLDRMADHAQVVCRVGRRHDTQQLTVVGQLGDVLGEDDRRPRDRSQKHYGTDPMPEL